MPPSTVPANRRGTDRRATPGPQHRRSGATVAPLTMSGSGGADGSPRRSILDAPRRPGVLRAWSLKRALAARPAAISSAIRKRRDDLENALFARERDLSPAPFLHSSHGPPGFPDRPVRPRRSATTVRPGCRRLSSSQRDTARPPRRRQLEAQARPTWTPASLSPGFASAAAWPPSRAGHDAEVWCLDAEAHLRIRSRERQDDVGAGGVRKLHDGLKNCVERKAPHPRRIDRQYDRGAWLPPSAQRSVRATRGRNVRSGRVDREPSSEPT